MSKHYQPEQQPQEALPTYAGRVIAGFGGFYEVLPQDASAAVSCKPRGRLRQAHEKILTGDLVQFSLLEDGSGMIEEILPRANQLLRPHIANVDQVVIVLAWRLPEYDLLLLDRMLLMCRLAGVETRLAMNKTDLMRADEAATLASLSATYAQAGCPVLTVSAEQAQGLAPLRAALQGKISVLAGPSGVGKSSLLNRLLPDVHAETSAVSDRLQRGRHTTRYVTLCPLPDDPAAGMLADTPGFFVLDAPSQISAADLPGLYPEYLQLFHSEQGCRFDSCRHHQEPDCAIRAAVAEGRLDAGRYQRYLRILEEIQTREVKYR